MLTRERAIALFEYRDGQLIWKQKTHPRANDCVGKRAGTSRKVDGSRQVLVDGRIYVEHQVIWLMFYGRFCSQIDHKNMDPSDNRIHNLRECTRAENGANRRAQRNNKSTGVKGVHLKSNGRYVASCCRRYLGTFDTIQEAIAAYADAAEVSYGEFARVA